MYGRRRAGQPRHKQRDKNLALLRASRRHNESRDRHRLADVPAERAVLMRPGRRRFGGAIFWPALFVAVIRNTVAVSAAARCMLMRRGRATSSNRVIMRMPRHAHDSIARLQGNRHCGNELS